MKKIFTLCVAAVAAMSLMAGNEAATFEDINVNSDSLYRSANPTAGGFQTWTSNDYTFATYVDTTYISYGSIYYYDITVSAKKAADFVNDYSTGYDMKSAAGGAAEGNNYAVWYYNYKGNAMVKLNNRDVISGMYVTNTTYAVSSMTNGDGYAKKFVSGDWFKLTVTGYQFGTDTTTKTLDFYLADFRTVGSEYIVTDWRWMDLTALGSVDALGFSLSSSDTGDYGMNTPAYFCFDNFGGNTATGLNNITTSVMGEKMLMNGQIVIRRGEHIFNLAGQIIR